MTKYKLLTLSSLLVITPLATVVACSKDASPATAESHIASIYKLFSKTEGTQIDVTSTKTQKEIDTTYFNDSTKCHLSLGESFGIASIKDIAKPSDWNSSYTMTKVQRYLAADAGKSLATYTIKYSITKGEEKKEITFVVNSKDLVLDDANSLANYNARKQFVSTYNELSLLTNGTKTAQSYRNNIELNREYPTAGMAAESMFGVTGIPNGTLPSGYAGFAKFTKLTENSSVVGKPVVVMNFEMILKKGDDVIDTYMSQVASTNNYVVYNDSGAVNKVLDEFSQMISFDFSTPHEGSNVKVFKSNERSIIDGVETELPIPTTLRYNQLTSDLNLISGKSTKDVDLLGSTMVASAIQTTIVDRLNKSWKALKVTSTITKGVANAEHQFYVVPYEYKNIQGSELDVNLIKQELLTTIGPEGALTSTLDQTGWEAVTPVNWTTFNLQVLESLGVTGKALPSDMKGTTIDYRITKNESAITLHLQVKKGSGQDFQFVDLTYTIAKP